VIKIYFQAVSQAKHFINGLKTSLFDYIGKDTKKTAFIERKQGCLVFNTIKENGKKTLFYVSKSDV
jgi:succinate dehydrogenase hydrophobic anchor subunit